MNKFSIFILSALLLIHLNGDLLSATEKGNCLNKFNRIRSEQAKKQQISNMNRLVLDDELEAKDDKELEKAECDANVMKKATFEAIRDVKNAKKVTEFISHPDRTQFACIKKICSLQNDPWILVSNIPYDFIHSAKEKVIVFQKGEIEDGKTEFPLLMGYAIFLKQL